MTTFAVLSDITPNRATVEAVHNDLDRARDSAAYHGCEIVVPVECDRPEVGERVWIDRNEHVVLRVSARGAR